jgi:hypothetical protein
VTEHAPDLKNETIGVLLAGWGATLPPDVNPGAHGFGGGMLELLTDGPADLWKEHEAFLRSVARTWGWTPTVETPRGLMFYAEALANGFEDAD